MKTVGIIGYGSFGSFLERKLSGRFELKIIDSTQEVPAKYGANIAQNGTCDYVVLAIPVAAYGDVLCELKPHLLPTTIVVDISSVKAVPVQLLKEIFLARGASLCTHCLGRSPQKNLTMAM